MTRLSRHMRSCGVDHWDLFLRQLHRWYHATDITHVALYYMQKAALMPLDAEGKLPGTTTTTIIPGEFVSSRKLQTLQLWMCAKGRIQLHSDFQGRHPLKQTTGIWDRNMHDIHESIYVYSKGIGTPIYDQKVSVKPLDCLSLLAKGVSESLMSDKKDPSRWSNDLLEHCFQAQFGHQWSFFRSLLSTGVPWNSTRPLWCQLWLIKN